MRCLKCALWLLAAGALTGWMMLATEAKAATSGPVHAGDHVAVAVNGARLMLGKETLARISRGQELQVIQVKGPWVGTSVTVGGKTLAGWVWNRQVTTRQPSVAGRSGARRYSYQPVPTAGRTSSQRLIMGETRYGRRYWRAERKVLDY